MFLPEIFPFLFLSILFNILFYLQKQGKLASCTSMRNRRLFSHGTSKLSRLDVECVPCVKAPSGPREHGGHKQDDADEEEVTAVNEKLRPNVELEAAVAGHRHGEHGLDEQPG